MVTSWGKVNDDEQLPVHSSMIRLMCKTAGITMFGDFYRDDHNVEEFEKLYEEVKNSGRSRLLGAQWLSGRVLDSRPRGRGFEPHWRHFVVSLSKNINPNLVLVQPRKTGPFIAERLLMGRKESNQTNKQTKDPGDMILKACWVETHQRHCCVSWSKTLYPLLY